MTKPKALLNESIAAAAGFWRSYRFPILLGLSLRLGLSAWLALVWWVVDPYFPLDGKALLETYGQMAPQATRLERSLVDVWLRWDAVHYVNIAREGYGGVGAAETNFLPLYPYLILWLKPLFGSQEVFTGLMISTLATILALIAFGKLVRTVCSEERLARWTVITWAMYPTSFFLLAPYTEAVFSALAIGCLLSMYKRQWLTCGILAALAGLTRAQGLLLIFPMIVFAWQDWRARPNQPVWLKLASIGLAPMGFLGFTAWRTFQGVGFYTASFSQYSRILFFDPLTGYFKALAFTLRVHDYISVTEMISVTVFLALAIWMWTQRRFRREPALLVYTLVNLALFTSKHALTASPLQSANRYVISLYPVFMGIAVLLLRLRPQTRGVVILASLIGWLLAATMHAMWLFVG